MNGSGLTKLTPVEISKIPKKTLTELAAPAPSGERHFQMGRLIIPMFRPQKSCWQPGRRHTTWRTAEACRSPRYIDGFRPLHGRKGLDRRWTLFGAHCGMNLLFGNGMCDEAPVTGARTLQ